MALGSGLRETGELLRGLRAGGGEDLRVVEERAAAAAATAQAQSHRRIEAAVDGVAAGLDRRRRWWEGEGTTQGAACELLRRAVERARVAR